MNDGRYLVLMGIGYLITILVETLVLVVALSRAHPLRRRLFAGVWLTACTYPVVWLVLPQIINPETDQALYLTVAETFAPVAECLLFWLAFDRPWESTPFRLPRSRDMLAIVVANVASFLAGLWMRHAGAWDEIERWVTRPGGPLG
jgi:hypothetical protein